MKMYLISDNIDTQIGMRLVGIDGCVAHDSETITAMVKEYLNHLKITLHTPLIIEIPDRHGSRDIANSINNMVQESIGLKL